MSEQRLSIGDLVNLLFEHVRKSDGSKYTNTEVSNATGLAFTSIKYIRDNVTPNPGISTLMAISKVFGVSIAFFEAETESEALGIIAQAKEVIPKIERWMFRISHLSESAQEDILRMVAWIEQAEAHRLRGGNLKDLQDERGNKTMVISPDE
jgi:transcriptional regulator with XRE-family HTH domain